jgi:3-hydroxy-9,10-secoandrosta-1,3,5(10)-triene-9,17-dione monooxygenase
VRRFRERLDGHQLFMVQSSQRSDPAAGARLAESSADTNAAELVLLDAARRLDEMAATPQEQLDPVDVATIHRDAAYGVRLCARAVDRLYEASGGSSLQRDEPMQRIWRDVHAARSHAILTWDAAATNYAAAVLG